MTEGHKPYSQHSLRGRLRSAPDIRAGAEVLAAYAAGIFDLCEISVILSIGGPEIRAAAPNSPGQSLSSAAAIAGGQACWGKIPIEIPLVASDLGRSELPDEILENGAKLGVLSIAVVPVFSGGRLSGLIECRSKVRFYRFREPEILALEAAAELFGLWIESRTQGSGAAFEKSSDDRARFAVQGNLLFIETDENYRINNVVGAAEAMLGLTPEEIKSTADIWRKIIHPQEVKPLIRKLRQGFFSSRDVRDEIRIIHQRTGEVRWIAIRGVGRVSSGVSGVGWEGFIFDVTDRRLAQDELEVQSRRIKALYEVSSSLQFNTDPALVALRGLRALIQATGSDCGYSVLYDANSGKMEVAAAEGLSEQYLDKLLSLIDGRTLLRSVIESKRGILLSDIQAEPRAAVDLAMLDSLRSTIMMPLVFEGSILGAIVIFCRKANRYNQDDFDLVQAAANQIGLVARQAESYTAERREASSFAALYRLTHQISKFLTPREIGEQSFPIINSEIPAKRMWLGVMNEQGTHLVGQCGFGPGIRRHIIDLQIEVELRHDFLDEAIRTKRPVIVRKGQKMECSGFNRVIAKLDPGPFIICPLVSLGQVIGALIVEPASPSVHFVQRKLPLLTGMASEIAAVILARRFELKMADAEKMRMAGVLASGVAHNFNNLLQAIMGQASLIEVQAPEESQLGESARTIIDSAGKGAALIRQMLSFTVRGSEEKAEIEIDKLLEDSRELYASLLGSDIVLELRLAEVGKVMGDAAQIQQIMTNLLLNAKEALQGRKDGVVRLAATQIRLRSGEVDRDLSPGVYIRVDVTDNGVGMDNEKLARCFEPFFTTKNVDSRTGLGLGGSGLGLSNAYSIAKSHNGILAARSIPGDGATFSLFLPVYSVQSEVISLNDDERAAITEQSLPQVLLLDVEEPLRVSIKAIAESLNMRVIPAPNRSDLIEAIQKGGSRIKAVVIDLDFASYDVIKLINLMRTISPAIGILGATADRGRWGSLFAARPRAVILDKPQSAWATRESFRALGLGAADLIEKEAVKSGSTKDAVEAEGADSFEDIFPDF